MYLNMSTTARHLDFQQLCTKISGNTYVLEFVILAHFLLSTSSTMYINKSEFEEGGIFLVYFTLEYVREVSLQ